MVGMGWLREGIKMCGRFEWSGLDGAVTEMSGGPQNARVWLFVGVLREFVIACK